MGALQDRDQCFQQCTLPRLGPYETGLIEGQLDQLGWVVSCQLITNIFEAAFLKTSSEMLVISRDGPP